MAIPSSINREHVLRAMRELSKQDWPVDATSTKFDVVTPEGELLPPKLVLSHAAQYVTGIPLSRRDFSGGAETNDRLTRLGFEIRPKVGVIDTITRISELTPGAKLNNDQLMSLFKVGVSGGMRWSTQTTSLVLVADHTKSLYDDRWLGSTLYYTGMGKTGHQTLTGQNKRLAEQSKTGVAVHIFEVFTENEYVYGGRVALSGPIQEEVQPDEHGDPRTVLVFPLTLIDADAPPKPNSKEIARISRKRQRSLFTRSTEELRKLALLGGKQHPGSRTVNLKQYERNQAVVEYTKKAANGHCDLCRQRAPFRTLLGPYLECHHLHPLAEGGSDTIDNAVALCPNCHRRMHLLNKAADLDVLRLRIERREDFNAYPLPATSADSIDGTS